MFYKFETLNVELFSYSKLINKSSNRGWAPKKLPNVLLSRIETLTDDEILDLENVNIYDLEDLINSEKLFKELGNNYNYHFDRIKRAAISTSLKIHKIPVIAFELPHNYAITSFAKYESSFDLAMSWKGLLFSYLNKSFEDFDKILSEFKKLLGYCNYPELITDIRNWNFTNIEGIEPTDLSVYISNYDVFSSIENYCEYLGQPQYTDEITKNRVLKLIYSIEFILWYSKYVTQDWLLS